MIKKGYQVINQLLENRDGWGFVISNYLKLCRCGKIFTSGIFLFVRICKMSLNKAFSIIQLI